MCHLKILNEKALLGIKLTNLYVRSISYGQSKFYNIDDSLVLNSMTLPRLEESSTMESSKDPSNLD